VSFWGEKKKEELRIRVSRGKYPRCGLIPVKKEKAGLN